MCECIKFHKREVTIFMITLPKPIESKSKTLELFNEHKRQHKPIDLELLISILAYKNKTCFTTNSTGCILDKDLTKAFIQYFLTDTDVAISARWSCYYVSTTGILENCLKVYVKDWPGAQFTITQQTLNDMNKEGCFDEGWRDIESPSLVSYVKAQVLKVRLHADQKEVLEDIIFSIYDSGRNSSHRLCLNNTSKTTKD